jgi:hypothetical protein
MRVRLVELADAALCLVHLPFALPMRLLLLGLGLNEPKLQDWEWLKYHWVRLWGHEVTKVSLEVPDGYMYMVVRLSNGTTAYLR